MKKLDNSARVNEVSNLAMRIVDFHSQISIEDSRLTTLITKLGEQNNNMLMAINPDFTKSNLEEYDSRRDAYWTDLYYALQGYCHLPIAAMSQDAELLFALVQKFGLSTSKKSYAEQSTDLEAVLIDLTNEDAHQAADRLQGINELIELLRVAQNDFHSAQLSYNQAIAAENTRPTASELKKEVLATINQQIIPYLNTMNMIEPEVYQELYQAVEKAIADINENILRRKKEEEEENLNNEEL